MGLSVAFMLVFHIFIVAFDYLTTFLFEIRYVNKIKVQAVSRSIRWGDDDSDSVSNDSTNQFKDGGSSGRVDFQLSKSNNPSSNNKRPSVRRLLSTSSAATTIAEDSEINI